MYPFERELYTEMLVDYLKAQEEARKRNNNG
jgi:hypothetical protein